MSQDIIMSRREELISSLKEIGLVLRHDSGLCHAYIAGTLDESWTLELVVEECALMHWLFMYTDYAERCRQAYEYFGSCNLQGRVLHEFIKYNIQPYIKADTIAFFGMPEKWPWLS